MHNSVTIYTANLKHRAPRIKPAKQEKPWHSHEAKVRGSRFSPQL